MKSSEPLLPKLPSLSELLKHPTVDRVVQRVNQTTVAQRAAGFLEELRANLRKRDIVPSIHHLAERLARRLLGSSQAEYPTINATGVVCGGGWSAPLAQTALDELARTASDYYESGPALHERAVDLLRALTGAESAWIAHSFEAAVRLTQEYAGGPLEVARYAGILNPAEWRLGAIATIADRLAQGVDAVVVEGGGLIGGPPAGIIVGRRTAVESINSTSWARTLVADDLTLAALVATLEIYRYGKSAIHEVPVLQLLSAPLENLQQRSERLAQLIAAVEGVDRAKPQAVESVWLQDADTKLAGPSWAITVAFKNLSPSDALQRLSSTSPRLVARAMDDAIQFDLRSVFPRWDQQLVASVENLTLGK